MVGRIVGLFRREVRSVQHAAYILAGATFLAQILSFVRDRLFAASFGATQTLDVYYASFRIPDIIFLATSSIISISVLLPRIQRADHRDAHDVSDLLRAVTTAFSGIVIVLSVIAWFLIPPAMSLLFPELGAHHQTLVDLSRLLLLSPILLGFSNILSAVVQANHRFLLSALAPVIYNVGIVIGTLFFVPSMGIYGVAIGVIIGACGHVFVQLPFVLSRYPKAIGLSWRLLRERSAIIWSIISVSLPRTISLSLFELAELVLIIIAGTMAAGSIAVTTFAWNLQSVPLSLIGVSFSVALFPLLSSLHLAGDMERFRERLIFTVRQITFWCLPISALVLILRAHLVRVVLGAGAFDWTATRLTAAVMALFVLSLVFQSLSLVFTRAWYALDETRRPLIAAFIGTLLTCVLAIASRPLPGIFPEAFGWLTSVLRVEGVVGNEVILLPLAFSIGAALTAILQFMQLRNKVKGLGRELLVPVSHHIIGALIGATTAYVTLQVFDAYVSMDRVLGVLLHGAAAGIIGCLAAAIYFFAVRSSELLNIFDGIKRRTMKVVSDTQSPV